jgi:protein-S-isoprenylcysteine O-methyltransferase Ste14
VLVDVMLGNALPVFRHAVRDGARTRGNRLRRPNARETEAPGAIVRLMSIQQMRILLPARGRRAIRARVPRMVTPSSPRPRAVSLLGVVPALALDAALLAVALGGPSQLAREPRALALLAIWGAGGIALALRRPALSHDAAETRPDPVAMALLALVPLLTPMAGAWAARHAWAMLPFAPVLSWAGVAAVAAGLALRVRAMSVLGSRFSPLVAIQREHTLQTDGPYARVRHPGYLGALLACAGGAVAFGSAAALPLVALMLAAQLARVRAEEALLAARFGDEWRAYARRTGALLPRLAPPR